MIMSKSEIATGVVHEVPEDLQKTLTADSVALAKWEDITPLARNEWICWVEDAKMQETRRRRIERVRTELKEGKRRPCCWPGCSHRRKKGNEMETINNIELTDENTFPDESVLRKVLGRSYNAYLTLLKLYDDNDLVHEWRYYMDGKAWLCKVQKKKRTIVWMSAWKGYMQAAVYFPVRYLEEIFSLGISDETKDRIRETKNVGKSKPCIFQIKNKKSIKDLEKVMKFKMSKR